jgi:hypothetical protein
MAVPAKKKTTIAKGKPKPSGRLADHLVLTGYMHSLFGKNSFDEMQALLCEVQEGYDEERKSFLFHALISWNRLDPRVRTNLETYDARIQGYVERINRHRDTPVTLTYFQQLAVLYTEIFLDRYFQGPAKFLDELNEYAYSLVEQQHLTTDYLYNEDDLRKLAFWMATGSGKTLILHINYLQFAHYNAGPNRINLDNILLITPNESMTTQHLTELAKSGIPAEPFQPRGGLFASTMAPSVVQVIDINKLTEEKKGQGVSVDIASFDTKNLVFVDEGHKGSGGTSWMDLRKKIASDGFTFQYSATFGQAVAATTRKSENNDLLTGYGKSILFDYSYRYFYRDGYGKDYRLLNVKDAKFDQKTKHVVMLANLLTFYQQKLAFEENPEVAREYNLEAPLWIFVGSRVQGKTGVSDVLEVVRFLSAVIRNDHGWTTSTIRSIYEGKSGLIDRNSGRDLFSPDYPEQKLAYLKAKNLTPEATFTDILSRVFHAKAPAPLHLVNLKTAQGEIALRCGNDNPYFGVINIGDDTDFIKLVETQETTVRSDKDELTASLFASIKEKSSPVNILIGARKFIEGWDTWRVSTMGLLNIGKSEGTQIIQLFGRGVRLQGKNHKLKRSRVSEESLPEFIPLLETLNIFGIEANYLEDFREYLKAEGIEDTFIDIPLSIRINEDYLREGLLIPYVDKRLYKKEEFFALALDDKITADIDLMPKVDIVESADKAPVLSAEAERSGQKIPVDLIEALDWNRIYFALLETKLQKNWYNFVFGKDELQGIIRNNLYRLTCPQGFVTPTRCEDLPLIENIVIAILRKYLQKYYDKQRNLWIKNHLGIRTLDKYDGNFTFTYHICVNEKEQALIDAIGKLIKDDIDKLCRGDKNISLVNIFFDRHLYQPLLAKFGDALKVEIHPDGLNTGEQRFVFDFRDHIERNSASFVGKKIFLLRNSPKRGVGFFENVNFFPDFIIWVVEGNLQHLIFVDPKGLVNIKSIGDEKIQLCHTIKDLEKRLNEKQKGPRITLDSFIVSVTEKQSVVVNFGYPSDVELTQNHILFQNDDPRYIEKMMTSVSGDQH